LPKGRSQFLPFLASSADTRKTPRGLAAYVTENLGLYAEVGYEWVDNFDATAGGLSADVDFSSFVVSAGLAFRF